MRSEYGADLGDLFTGRLTLRQVAVWVDQMPPGSRLGKALGGPAAWSDTVTAIHDAGYLIRGALHSVIHALTSRKPRDPQRVTPPEPGWQEKQAEQADRQQRKARNWARRKAARDARK